MKKNSFYKKMGSIMVLSLGSCLPLFSQVDTSGISKGSYEYPIYDPTITVYQTDPIHLSVSQKGDSVVWKTNLDYYRSKTNTIYSKNIPFDTLEAQKDVFGTVLVKDSGVWKYTYFSFQGIENHHNDTLFAPFIPNAEYYWFNENGRLEEKNYFLDISTIQPKAKKYSVVIGGLGFDTLVYHYTITDTTQTLGTYANPYVVSNLIEHSGLDYTISNNYAADSAFWYYQMLGNDSSVTSYSSEKSISIYGDAIVQATIIASNGIWYTQKGLFRGISYDSTVTGKLEVPTIRNATYTWYLNDSLLQDVKTPSYTPQDTGTYKVIVVWTIGANLRTEAGTNTAIFEFKVKTLPITTSIEEVNFDSSKSFIYPNPTSENVYINKKGTFEYQIESSNSTIVNSGIGNDLTQINLNGLNPGIYFVHIKTDNKQTVNKLIVK